MHTASELAAHFQPLISVAFPPFNPALKSVRDFW
jgi:hypothetical protein